MSIISFFSKSNEHNIWNRHCIVWTREKRCKLPKGWEGFTQEILCWSWVNTELYHQVQSHLVKSGENNARSDINGLTFISDAHQHILQGGILFNQMKGVIKEPPSNMVTMSSKIPQTGSATLLLHKCHYSKSQCRENSSKDFLTILLCALCSHFNHNT